MGWTILRGALPQGETRESYLRKSVEDLTPEATAKGSKNEVVASKFVGSIWYAAVRITRPGKAPVVAAMVFLTCGSAARGFGYKDMDETMGPVECSCPIKILDMLSPVQEFGLDATASLWAREWRERCREKAACR